GGETIRVAGDPTDQVRVRHQPTNGSDARSQRAADAARHSRRGDRMMRREFITLLGGAVGPWPPAAPAQQGERVRRIGALLTDDAQYQAWCGGLLQALGQTGWTIGRNVQVDTRWATANADSVRRHATELAALAPDVIVSPGASTVGPLLQVTRTI